MEHNHMAHYDASLSLIKDVNSPTTLITLKLDFITEMLTQHNTISQCAIDYIDTNNAMATFGRIICCSSVM